MALCMVILSVALPARAEKEITTAGTGNPTLTTGDAPDSICPYAWRLPGYSGSGSYYDLMTNIYRPSGANKDTIVLSVPLSFLRAGNYVSSGSLYEQALFGGYWSSRRNGTTGAYFLGFAWDYLSLQSSVNRSYGFSLRCLAR